MLSRAASTDPDESDRIQILINSYSSQIRRYAGRQFKPVEAGVAKKYRYEGSGLLSLSPWELNGEPTAITLYTDYPETGWVVLDEQAAAVESQYRLEPRQRTLEGTYLWLSLPEIGM